MIAHVAAVGENKGRVLLGLGPRGRLSDVVLEAAMRIAEAFNSEIESLFIEDRQLIDFASFPFAREISLSGRVLRALPAGSIERDMQVAAAALERHIKTLARKFNLSVRCRAVPGEMAAALSGACAENGPWNVVALGEPVSAQLESQLVALIESVEGTTGFVLAGPRARRTTGPVVALIETIERVPPMLRAAERLAAVSSGDARLLLTDEDAGQLRWLEDHVRLALAGEAGGRLVVAESARGSPDAVAEVLRRMGAGFVIAQYGGRFVGREVGVSRFARTLEGPLFIVR